MQVSDFIDVSRLTGHLQNLEARADLRGEALALRQAVTELSARTAALVAGLNCLGDARLLTVYDMVKEGLVPKDMSPIGAGISLSSYCRSSGLAIQKLWISRNTSVNAYPINAIREWLAAREAQ